MYMHAIEYRDQQKERTKETKVIHANRSRGSSSKQQTKQCVRQTQAHSHSHSHGTHFILMCSPYTHIQTHTSTFRVSFGRLWFGAFIHSYVFFVNHFHLRARTLSLHRYRICTICHYFAAAGAETVAANTIHVCRNSSVRPSVPRQAMCLLVNIHCKFLFMYEH